METSFSFLKQTNVSFLITALNNAKTGGICATWHRTKLDMLWAVLAQSRIGNLLYHSCSVSELSKTREVLPLVNILIGTHDNYNCTSHGKELKFLVSLWTIHLLANDMTFCLFARSRAPLIAVIPWRHTIIMPWKKLATHVLLILKIDSRDFIDPKHHLNKGIMLLGCASRNTSISM